MSALHERILDLLAAEITARDRWDEQPSLYFMYHSAGRPRLSDLGIPSGIWNQARPPAVLEWMAAALEAGEDLLRPVIPPGLIGIAFRCEGWEVFTSSSAEPEKFERARADAIAHVLHEHPDRTEIRFINAVDRAGITYMAAMRRDTGEIHQRRIIYPKPSDPAAATGSVVDSCDRILTALLGVHLPERIEPPWPGEG